MTTTIRRALAAALLLVYAGIACAAEHEHGTQEFEIFWAADAFYGTHQSHIPDDTAWVNADILFGITEHQFKVFGEYYVTTEEHDLERFQLGWEFVPDTTLWFGRFHQPASAWNSQHHHGRYLQTAISRPYIERWEDEQGLIPQHITGALFDTRQALPMGSALQFSAGVGAGPGMPNGESHYEPIDLLGENNGRHRLSASGRLAFLPEYEGQNQAGLVFAHDHVSTSQQRFTTLLATQDAAITLYGAYADWTIEPWRVMATTYYIDIQLDLSVHDESFIAGYAQIERTLPFNLTAFGRIEQSSRMGESKYVSLFDDHDGDIDVAIRREAFGVRWDFLRRQALTIELAHVDSQIARSNEIRLQWSGVIP